MLRKAMVFAGSIVAITGYPVHADKGNSTSPTTAASFPAAAIPVAAGTIDYWAKLSGFSGTIPSGTSPYLSVINDNSTWSSYTLGFNANDGVGNGGLVGSAGGGFATGTSGFGEPTYEDVLGTAVDKWHHYALKWNENGLTNVPGQKVAVYIDDVMRSTRWDLNAGNPNGGTFPALLSGTLNLIMLGNPAPPPSGARIAIDEFKIFDGNNNLVLYNTLDSSQDVAHSAVGLNGSFNGYGDPRFVPGILGNALEATPVTGNGPAPPIPEPGTYVMFLAGLGLMGFMTQCRKTS